MKTVSVGWKAFTRKARRIKSRVDDAVFEYGPIVIVAGAVAGYLTWGSKWFR